MDGGDWVHRHGRRRWDTGAVAARAAPCGWPELRSELPGVLRLGTIPYFEVQVEVITTEVHVLVMQQEV
jgi:hypothetical protein